MKPNIMRPYTDVQSLSEASLFTHPHRGLGSSSIRLAKVSQVRGTTHPEYGDYPTEVECVGAFDIDKNHHFLAANVTIIAAPEDQTEHVGHLIINSTLPSDERETKKFFADVVLWGQKTIDLRQAIFTAFEVGAAAHARSINIAIEYELPQSETEFWTGLAKRGTSATIRVRHIALAQSLRLPDAPRWMWEWELGGLGHYEGGAT